MSLVVIVVLCIAAIMVVVVPVRYIDRQFAALLDTDTERAGDGTE
jgi:hypothetical protein